ncbi:hypothetical protein [Haloarchaeobius sp. HME9146]|uniref:hypothetical protein n=1 Tax=Haloarchaeobius sp. HME9146 TaxID=2978732 RepID=UPI0021BE2223|nr:hypothetical protein [Haloarchaeobius sp. HME9146]MCT9097351.1 hypothetical protein [Haloarchaeobius sp. HME9146]
MQQPSSRRRVIATLSGVALTGLGVGAVHEALDLDQVAFSSRAALTPDGESVDPAPGATDGARHALLVAWREEYNGELVEDATLQTADEVASGPLLEITDAKPGDEGLLVLHVEVFGDRPGRVRLSLPLTKAAENGQNEPEEHAPDPLPDKGELQRHVDVELWYDDGVLVEGVGGCNGNRDMGETHIAEGTLAEVSEQLAAGRPLVHPGKSDGCLSPGQSFCVSLSWSIDRTVRNSIQSDSVAFSLGLGLEDCAGGDG